MPEAVRRVIRYCFERMDLNRVEARCIAENTASARVMEKAGMSYEGTLRESRVRQGRLQGHEDLLHPQARIRRMPREAANNSGTTVRKHWPPPRHVGAVREPPN